MIQTFYARPGFNNPNRGFNTNDGTTTSTPLLDFNGATAVKLNPGDTIYFEKSPDASSTGIDASWAQNSKNVILDEALTKTVNLCQSTTAWTSDNTGATWTSDTGQYKFGTRSAKVVITTGAGPGLLGHFPVPLGDYSEYTQLSMWMYCGTILNAGTLSMRVYDTTSATGANYNEFPLPASAAVGGQLLAIDSSVAMRSDVTSIALYANAYPGAQTLQFSDIIACKSPDRSDSLTLASLISKPPLNYWAADTSYTTNDLVRPSIAAESNRYYKCTTPGNSGLVEPTWSWHEGATVIDSTVVWTDQGMTEGWYGIQSINDTTVVLDGAYSSNSGTVTGTYFGTTEKVRLWKRECWWETPITSQQYDTLDSGTFDSSMITYIGGYNFATGQVDGETFWDHRSSGRGLNVNGSYTKLYNMGFYRSAIGINIFTNGASYGTRNIYSRLYIGNNLYGILFSANCYSYWSIVKSIWCNFNTYALTIQSFYMSGMLYKSCQLNSSTNYGIYQSTTIPNSNTFYSIDIKNNATAYGTLLIYSMPGNKFYWLHTSGTPTGAISLGNNVPFEDIIFDNCKIDESVEVLGYTSVPTTTSIYSMNHDQQANNHWIWKVGGTINSTDSTRHTASGIAWKMSPNNAIIASNFPLKLKVAEVLLEAGKTNTVSCWMYRDTSNITANLVCPGLQIAGYETDVSSTVTSTADWQQRSVVLTPTATGVVQIEAQCYGGTTNNVYVDDISFTSV